MMQFIAKNVVNFARLIPFVNDIHKQLGTVDVYETLESELNPIRGFEIKEEHKTLNYSIRHTIEDGIEYISYVPHKPRFVTPILMQHGMWHGAWCWQHWQELFAEWGWQSVAYSLPNHGASHQQRQMTEATLDYYLFFLKSAIDRMEIPPILMGHSMGGALAQWYLRYVADNLPAVILVGSWVYDNSKSDGTQRFVRLDPLGVIMTLYTRTATQYIRTPETAARLLISDNCIYSPTELHQRLDPESALVLLQHNPPYWTPPESISTPMLYVAGEKDAVVSIKGARATAEFYDADLIVIPDCAHNIMMDAHYATTSEQIHHWLTDQEIN